MTATQQQKQPTHFVLLFCLLYFSATLFCLAWEQVADATAVPWLPNAVLAAFLIHSRYTRWPLLIACAAMLQLAASAGSGQLILNSVKFLPATLLEATLSAWLLRRYLPKGAFTRNMGNVIRLLVLGIFIPAVVGATVGSLTLSTFLPTASSKPLSVLWVHWYISDVLGLLALLPISMRSGSLTWRDFTQHSPTEFIGLTILTLILTVLAFRYLPYPYSYTVTLLLLLTIRIKPFGITLIGGLAICLTSLALTAGLVHLPPVNSLFQQTALYIPLALMQIPPLLLSVALQQSSDERQRLALSEARFRNAMRSAPSGMAVLTLSGDIYKANPAFCRLLGYSCEDLQKRAMPGLTHPEDLNEALNLTGQLLRQEIEDFTLDIRILPKHRSPMWVRITLSPILEDGGQLYYLLLQTQDIDQQKRLDLETNRLNERMRLATQAAQVGIWELDPESLTFIIDAKMAELYGIPARDKPIDLHAWLNAVHPEDRTAVHDQLKAAITQCTTYDTEFRIVRPNGAICHVRAEAIVISHSGKAVRVVGSLRDVTEYKQLTEALHEEKERLQVTLASIGDAVLTTDIEGRITFLNPAAEALTGWMLTEAQGHPHQDVFRIFNSETLEPLPSPVTRCLETQTTLSPNESATLVNRQEERYDIQDSVAPVRTLDGAVIGAVLVFQNVTSARALQRELSYNASHDALTGLFNRLKFEQELNRAWQSAKERQAAHALCFIDLDRFKIVNDSAGHAAGDTLLRELSHLLRDTLRASDTLARLGGDEFGLLLYDCDLPQAEAVANKLIAAISAVRFQWEDRLYDVGASAGIVAITAETRSTAELMSQADVACYAAKHSGRNRAELYQAGREEVEKQHREILLASGLRDALEHDRFTLYAQPIVPTRESAQGPHVELLLRLRNSEGHLIPPGTFIPAAERFGLMSSLDRWVVRQVLCEQATAIQAIEGFSVGINLSGNSLDDPLFLPYLLDLIAGSPLAPERLHFELTETAVVSKLSIASRLINRLRELGCKVALDDFGSGLSSFNYLKNFAVDIIKIDGSFVRHLDTNPLDQTIVASIHHIARHLGAQTVAEFVESQAAFEQLQAIGVDYAQGYAIGRPEPLTETLQRLHSAKAAAASAS